MSFLPTPIPALKVFDVVPGYVYAAALAIVLIGGGVTLGVKQIEIAGLNVKVVEQQRDAEALRADRERVARDHVEDVVTRERAHANKQQGIVDEYQNKLTAAEDRRRNDVARAERVHSDAQAAAARDREGSRSDPAACQRVADRNAVLYTLVDEGFSLVTQGRGLLEKRDAAVEALKGIITNDRAAICGPKQKP